MNINQWQQRWNLPQQAIDELLTLMTPVSEIPTPAGNQSEDWVQNEVRRIAPHKATWLMRNNSGAMFNETGQMVRFGLGNDSVKINKEIKSSDLIGMTSITVRPEHVGATFGIFTAVECKPMKWKKPSNDRERAQEKFMQLVIARGGFAQFCNHPGVMQWHV